MDLQTGKLSYIQVKRYWRTNIKTSHFIYLYMSNGYKQYFREGGHDESVNVTLIMFEQMNMCQIYQGREISTSVS